MKEKEGSKITIQVPGPIKLTKLDEAIEKALKKKVKNFKTDILNSGDEVVIQVDDNGFPPPPRPKS